MNWGKGIFITFIIFAGIMTTMVVISMRQEVGLVAPDYYKQEIAYQDQIDRMNNYNQLTEKPSVSVDRTTSEVVVSFPKSQINLIEGGEIQLFRSSQTGLDQSFELKLDELGEQRIKVSQFLKGKWKVKLFWKGNTEEYYNEVTINL